MPSLTFNVRTDVFIEVQIAKQDHRRALPSCLPGRPQSHHGNRHLVLARITQMVDGERSP